MSTAVDQLSIETASSKADGPSVVRKLLTHGGIRFGAPVLILLFLIALAAPLLGTADPAAIDPTLRNQLPFASNVVVGENGEEAAITHWMGTDTLGRDLYSRVLYGARVSLIVGFSVAFLAIGIGLVIGLASGYIRWLDAIVMRIMDGLMAIPAILLALGLVALWGAGLVTVILAITVPQIPWVVRLVRSVVLSVREEPYVEAVIAVGTPTYKILYRHIFPNTVAPLIVQATYTVGFAILVEAILSFLGVGIPTDIPTWGNIMAEGRLLFRVYPHAILFPGIFLALAVLAINVLGDGLRDTLDPRFAKRTAA